VPHFEPWIVVASAKMIIGTGTTAATELGGPLGQFLCSPTPFLATLPEIGQPSSCYSGRRIGAYIR
jgi:hypothetical protein